MKIEAAVLRATNTPLSVEPLELASPGAGEVLVEMKASGVCHSDWHVVTGDSVVDLPVVLGHEGSGVVAELGPGVDDLAVGDHVALSWIPFCDDCRACEHGHTHLCQTYLPSLWSGTMLDGTRRLADAAGDPVHHLSAISTWATHSVVPAVSCVKMPDVPYEISALIGCGVTTGVGAALNKAKIQPGSSVAVYGAGGVGLSIVMGAVLSGASTIIVIDLNADKEALARSFGATHFVVTGDGIDPVVAVREITDGIGTDYAFDAVGHTGIETQLIATIAQFGTAVMVGFPKSGSTFDIDPAHIIRDEKVLTGSIFGSAHTHRDFVRYAELYAEGRLPLDRLVTGRYDLAQINDACEAMLTGMTGRGVLVF
ncbi:MAG: Zn-dependent alcohol dehydrogenase [Actinomycetota bacterium]